MQWTLLFASCSFSIRCMTRVLATEGGAWLSTLARTCGQNTLYHQSQIFFKLNCLLCCYNCTIKKLTKEKIIRTLLFCLEQDTHEAGPWILSNDLQGLPSVCFVPEIYLASTLPYLEPYAQPFSLYLNHLKSTLFVWVPTLYPFSGHTGSSITMKLSSSQLLVNMKKWS